MKHTCIRPSCNATYEDSDPEPYYCPPCNEQRKLLAKDIDRKIGTRPSRQGPSFDERMAALPRIPGTNIPFIQ